MSEPEVIRLPRDELLDVYSEVLNTGCFRGDLIAEVRVTVSAGVLGEPSGLEIVAADGRRCWRVEGA